MSLHLLMVLYAGVVFLPAGGALLEIARLLGKPLKTKVSALVGSGRCLRRCRNPVRIRLQDPISRPGDSGPAYVAGSAHRRHSCAGDGALALGPRHRGARAHTLAWTSFVQSRCLAGTIC